MEAQIEIEANWSTDKLQAGLVAKYSSPEYALFFEVPDATGAVRGRAADALAMSCWPSRGLDLIGFELKASRNDWLREKKSPEKAEAICKYCDAWYIVAGSPAIVKEEELPSTWGLIVPRGGRLVIKREAPKLTPVPVDRNFLAALLRRAYDSAPTKKLAEEVKRDSYSQGYKQGERIAREEAERTMRSLQQERDKLKQACADFEAQSGLKMDRWTNGHELGRAVAFILSKGLQSCEPAMLQAEKSAQSIINTVQFWREAVQSKTTEDA